MSEGENDVPLGTARLRDMPPEEVAALIADVLRRLPQRDPPPSPPSGSMTGADAKLILQHPDVEIDALQRVVGILLMAQGMTREQIIAFVHDEISPFLTREEIRGEGKGAAQDLLEDIHLLVKDPKQKQETAESVRKLIELIDEPAALPVLLFVVRLAVFLKGLGKKVGGALILAGIYELMRRAGIKDLPAPPGLGE